ncbi:FecR family protein [uncultured Muribaculum sp.]|uniref:FecR family protein n=1 Tax=uncultured Muribaculum sp. TaxID=1918613 RepID=UPI0025FD8322|nr:FecR domain-containing protein [uncultured Muribaculum sp.]
MTPDKDLFDKFHSDRLSPDELRRLREDVNGMSDDEVDQCLSSVVGDDTWRFDPDCSEALCERLVAEAGRSSRRRRMWFIAGMAAAALLPVVIAVSVVLGVKVSRLDRYENVIAREQIVKTGVGEELLTVLPDGSRVRMAPESELRYSLSSYNDRVRDVDWDGEGLFEVARNEDSPFTVHAEEFDVRVLGTVFSVDVRRSASEAKVYLESGSIELSSMKGGERCRLTPGCLATISRTTGRITMRRMPDFSSDMGGSVMNFYDVALRDVLERMGLYYPKRFEAPEDMAGMTFTGALPKNNLDEAMTILGKAYGVEVAVDAERVRLRKRQ